MQTCARLSVRASASTSTANAPTRTLKALNISKRTLIDSNGGRAVRNVDNRIYEIIHEAANDSVKVLCKQDRLQYETEVGKDARISIILESAKPLAGGMPSMAELQTVLKFDGPGPEAINGRTAMLAVLGTLATELATGRPLLEQLSSPVGAAAAVALSLAVSAASLAPALTGKVRVEAAFPSANDSFPDRQLPYFWTALAETINGRVAMIGMAGILVNELVRGTPLL